MNTPSLKTIVTTAAGALVAGISAGGVPSTWYQWLGLFAAMAGGVAALKTTPPVTSTTPQK